MSAHVLFNLLNDSRKRDKMLSLMSISSLFPNEFNKFINNTGERMLDSIYHMTVKILNNRIFGMKASRFTIFYAVT